MLIRAKGFHGLQLEQPEAQNVFSANLAELCDHVMDIGGIIKTFSEEKKMRSFVLVVVVAVVVQCPWSIVVVPGSISHPNRDELSGVFIRCLATTFAGPPKDRSERILSAP